MSSFSWYLGFYFPFLIHLLHLLGCLIAENVVDALCRELMQRGCRADCLQALKPVSCSSGFSYLILAANLREAKC